MTKIHWKADTYRLFDAQRERSRQTVIVRTDRPAASRWADFPVKEVHNIATDVDDGVGHRAKNRIQQRLFGLPGHGVHG
ncbi:MAG: hypothetical protein MI861_13035 [Pirellulales bacterium]|nr:hypothetical protein [Pirellulales bacterium]